MKPCHPAFGSEVDAFIEACSEIWAIVFFDRGTKYTLKRHATFGLARKDLYELAGEKLPS